MSLAITPKNEIAPFSNEQVALIKNYLCKGITDEEVKLFHAVCKKTGLDPFMKQIYAVKRKNYKTGTEDMTIQTSIDGYRLIAERTGRYCPGRESTYQYQDGKVICSTSYVKKQTADGTWHEVAASAYYSEYAPPITKNGYENPFWKDKPHIMLAKCAECLALRKAFPNELGGLYSDEEMQQSESTISEAHATELEDLLALCSPDYQSKFFDRMRDVKKVNSISMLPESDYEITKKNLLEKSAEYQNSLVEVSDAAAI